MKITAVDSKLHTTRLLEPLETSSETITYIKTIIVRVTTAGGLVGYGEASPCSSIAGEGVDSTLGFLGILSEQLVGFEASALAGIHHKLDELSNGQTAAKAAIDIALHDILAQRAQLPLFRFLGGSDPRVQINYTISFNKPEVMANSAREAVDKGFRHLKVKCGHDCQQDVDTIAAIREAVGPDVVLRLDANQGWIVHEAIEALHQMEAYDILGVEQPLLLNNFEGMSALRKSISQALVLNGDRHSPEYALLAAQKGICDMINIKLMKSGGIYPALKINAIAEAAGMNCMVGCLMETLISTGAGAHLVASRPTITIADLEVCLKVDEQDCIRGAFDREGDVLILRETPGLGVVVDFEAL